ncbi:MAG: hypothetical protein AAFO07_24925 [Bacteroidota bacterium]
MKPFVSTFFIVLFIGQLGWSQKGIEGLWEGEMTLGGIYSHQTVKFEMLLQRKGKQVFGKSLIHINENEIIQMEVSGYFYMDNSVYMNDIKFIPMVGENEDMIPPYYRKYQFIFDRSIWESKIDGYWQEIKGESFDPSRERGRISLKKIKKKAKA